MAVRAIDETIIQNGNKSILVCGFESEEGLPILNDRHLTREATINDDLPDSPNCFPEGAISQLPQ